MYGKKVRVNRHHRKPKSRGGDNSVGNISRVEVNKHRAWHTLFENMTAQEIANEINRTWIDPEYFLVVRRTS